MKALGFAIALTILIVLAMVGLIIILDIATAEEQGVGTFYDEDYNVACWTYKTSIDCVFIAPDDRPTTSFKKVGE